jgi:hypothetical protein
MSPEYREMLQPFIRGEDKRLGVRWFRKLAIVGMPRLASAELLRLSSFIEIRNIYQSEK